MVSVLHECSRWYMHILISEDGIDRNNTDSFVQQVVSLSAGAITTTFRNGQFHVQFYHRFHAAKSSRLGFMTVAIGMFLNIAGFELFLSQEMKIFSTWFSLLPSHPLQAHLLPGSG